MVLVPAVYLKMMDKTRQNVADSFSKGAYDFQFK